MRLICRQGHYKFGNSMTDRTSNPNVKWYDALSLSLWLHWLSQLPNVMFCLFNRLCFFGSDFPVYQISTLYLSQFIFISFHHHHIISTSHCPAREVVFLIVFLNVSIVTLNNSIQMGIGKYKIQIVADWCVFITANPFTVRGVGLLTGRLFLRIKN